MKNTTRAPRKKHRFLAGICLALMILVPNLHGEVLIDRIVAQVNDDIISLYDLNQAIKPYVEKVKTMGYPPDQERDMLYKVRTEALDDLIANKLTDQVAKEKGLNVSEKEINNAMERVKKTNQLTEEQFVQALAQDGITLEEFRKNAKEQILRSKLVNQEIQSKIVVTQEDVTAYYKKNLGKYGGEKKYHLRTIVKRIQPEMEEEARAARDLMENIVKKLDQGESFADLAKAHSDLMAEEGGDIGSFGMDSLSEEIKAAVGNLKAGEHTPVLTTPQGLQIFQLAEIIDTAEKPVEAVSQEIEDILYKEVVDRKFKEWIENLKKQAHIKIIE
jgi:peptidyl-prolyl cis-trans isomerase SurA